MALQRAPFARRVRGTPKGGENTMNISTAVGLIPSLIIAYVVVLGGAAVLEGWQLLRSRQSPRYRRGAVVPPVAAIEQDAGGGR